MRSEALARFRRLLALLVAASAIMPAMLWAHAALRRSEPADGAHLDTVPRRLLLEFTEAVALPTARVLLRGPVGDTISLSALEYGDSARRIVVAGLSGPTRAGEHTVEWTVAGTDGHPVRGTIRFSIDSMAMGLASPRRDTAGVRAPAGGSDTGVALDASHPLYVAARFLGYAAILGLLGAVMSGLVVIPRAEPDHEMRRVLVGAARRAGIVSAMFLAVLAVGRLVLQTWALRGSWDMPAARQLVTGTVWGAGWWMQTAGALVAVVLLLRRRSVPFGPTVVAAGLAVAVSASLAGHPVAVPELAPVAVALDTVHVLSVGSWMGTLAVIVFAVLPAASALAGDARANIWRRVLVAFTPVALTSAGVLVLSGAAGAWLQLGGVSPLFTTTYGRLLLVKIAIVAGMAGLGALNWRRVVPRLSSTAGVSRFRASGGAELALAVLALLVTAVLTATPPPAVGGP